MKAGILADALENAQQFGHGDRRIDQVGLLVAYRIDDEDGRQIEEMTHEFIRVPGFDAVAIQHLGREIA